VETTSVVLAGALTGHGACATSIVASNEVCVGGNICSTYCGVVGSRVDGDQCVNDVCNCVGLVDSG